MSPRIMFDLIYPVHHPDAPNTRWLSVWGGHPSSYLPSLIWSTSRSAHRHGALSIAALGHSVLIEPDGVVNHLGDTNPSFYQKRGFSQEELRVWMQTLHTGHIHPDHQAFLNTVSLTELVASPAECTIDDLSDQAPIKGEPRAFIDSSLGDYLMQNWPQRGERFKNTPFLMGSASAKRLLEWPGSWQHDAQLCASWLIRTTQPSYAWHYDRWFVLLFSNDQDNDPEGVSKHQDEGVSIWAPLSQIQALTRGNLSNFIMREQRLLAYIAHGLTQPDQADLAALMHEAKAHPGVILFDQQPELQMLLRSLDDKAQLDQLSLPINKRLHQTTKFSL